MNQNVVTNTMNKYGDNKWWTSYDYKVIAYYQMTEEVLLVDYKYFYECVEKFLGRKIENQEWSYFISNIRKEVITKWEENFGILNN